MARTWFAGSATSPMDPPSRGAVQSKTGNNPAPSTESELSRNKVAVKNFATAHPIIARTKATHSNSDSGGPVNWTTPSTSPQKEPNFQSTAKEAIDASSFLAKLIQQHSKPNESQGAITTKSKDPRIFKPAGEMDGFAPSSSVQRRAPTAQMVPLNAAVTNTPSAAAITNPETTTTSLFGPGPSTMIASHTQAFFPITAPTSLLLPSLPILASSPSAPQKNYAPKPPKITLTPAPATAPSAFKDAAHASHVQNTKFLSPSKQKQTNGIKKRQYNKKNRPILKSSSTPEPKAGEKREPGRRRTTTRTEKQPLDQSKQHRPPIEPCTPLPRTIIPNQSSSCSSSIVSTLSTQHQQTATPQTDSDLTSSPTLCSEEPRLWPGRGDYVASLLRFNTKPQTIHSEPIQACANHAAHQDPQNPHSHGVCITCRHGAFRHIKATRSDLLGSAWWPLCKMCSGREMLRIEPGNKGCFCFNAWLCFSCLMEVVEKRSAKNSVEVEFRRRTLIGKGMDGKVSTVMTGWACECGKEVGSGVTLMKCIGCQGMRIGNIDPQETTVREKMLRKTALAWT